MKIALTSLLEDAKGGQIPFFEYHPHNGSVTTHGKVVWQGKPVDERMSDSALDDIISEMASPHGVNAQTAK